MRAALALAAAAHTAAGGCVTEEGMDYHGHDLVPGGTNTTAASPDACCALCDANGAGNSAYPLPCAAWTWAPPAAHPWDPAPVNYCWLKYSGAGPRGDFAGGFAGSSSPAPCKNIVELARSVPALATLVKAIVAADLADTLEGPAPFTVFAPTNDAFAALPNGTLDNLLKPENKQGLRDVLNYHVLAAPARFSYDLRAMGGETVETVEGKNVTVRVSPGQAPKSSPSFPFNATTINGADMVFLDVEACNGVVHVIDQVLLPAPVSKPLDTYACSVCAHVYDAAADGGGAAFADLPDTWTCPICGAPKSAYAQAADGTWKH